MDTAVDRPLQTAALPVAAGFGARLMALPGRAKASLALGIAALVGIVLAMSAWNSHGDYRCYTPTCRTRTAARSSPSSRR